MSLQHLAFKDIDEKALSALVADGVAESKVLEYKQDLQVATDEQKQEFLSDVTALANTNGGDLVFGMRADNGVAKELVGLKNFVPDRSLGQLENLLRDFLQPRLTGVNFSALPLSNGNHALVVRVPRSFASPHMVTHQGVTRFCGRNSNGKYDLDVNELRSAFLASETMSDRLRNFRLDRINKLAAGSTPVVLTSPHLIVLHLLPVVSARPDIRLGTADFQKLKQPEHLRPIGSHGMSTTFNMDGLLATSSWEQDSNHAYVQVFRNGYLEAVESQALAPRSNTERIIPSIAWEKYILEGFPTYLEAMQTLQLPPPYVVSLALLNVRGFTMYTDHRYCHGSAPIDRDHLLTDDILIESTKDSPGKILRPLFDQIWNGCGWPRSLNYGPDGEWAAHR